MRAQSGDASSSMTALNELCEIYRPALLHFLRGEGWEWDLAEEMTQAFFEYVIETELFRKVDRDRGRLRSLLLTSLRNFCAGEFRKVNAVRRGGLLERAELEIEELTDDLETEARFDYYCYANLLDLTMLRLREEYGARGRGDEFAVLSPLLSDFERGVSYPIAAARLGVSEGAARTAFTRLRERFRELIHEAIAETLGPGDDLEVELHHMTVALRQGPP